MTKTNKKILILDGYGFIFRAYHVQPDFKSPQGQPVGALYGFTTMLLKILKDFTPSYAVIALDYPGKNYRHQIYDKYKSNRPPIPEDLKAQIKMVQRVAESLNFKCISHKGFEADDIIATLAKRCSRVNISSIIISSDKDLMQLLDSNIQMYDPSKSRYIDEQYVLNKFGVLPSKVREVQALMGDRADNIPGVPGIGVKTAAKLINQFGDIDTLLSNVDDIESARYRGLIKEHINIARISWDLVGLSENVKIENDIEQLKWQKPETEQLADFLNYYGFKSLSARVGGQFKNTALKHCLKINEEKTKQAHVSKIPIQVKNKNDLEPLFIEIERSGVIGISYREINDDINAIELILCTYQNTFLVPYAYNASDINIDLNEQIHNIFTDQSVQKVTFSLKELMKKIDCTLQSFDDIEIMNYILSAGKKNKDIIEIIESYLNVELNKDDNTQIEITRYFEQCYHILLSKLLDAKSLHLYKQIDLPLCHILNVMEIEGITIDSQKLIALSLELVDKIKYLAHEIFTIAGQEFNILSPQQLGKVLFEDMNLPYPLSNKPKIKSYSTNAEVLNHLSNQGHNISHLVLRYRHLSKLKNSYLDTLVKQADPITHKIHTTFLQTSTSTGRLSSISPNIQNIPLRTKEGNIIRSSFIAQKGCKLISADYSQIELRVLSCIANIEILKLAFFENQDIHTKTASQIFKIPLDQVTLSQRRNAKAINFGIIYGMSAFGLSRQINSSKSEASEYIKKYFESYPGIKEYMDSTIEFAHTYGFVVNMLGRKCFIPTINSENRALQSLGERAAINAPIQSIASDIVKIAMIKLDAELTTRSFKTKMILQIHDELIFEAPEDELQEVSQLIKLTMENVNIIDVGTNVNLKVGSNWSSHDNS